MAEAAAATASAPYTPLPTQAPPAAPPMAAPPMAAPPAPMPASSMAEGGDVSEPSKSPVKDFFADVDILDVTISAFIVGAVLYSVHYYKFMMMMEKTGYADLSGRIAKMETAMAKKAAAEANGAKKQRRPVMRIS